MTNLELTELRKRYIDSPLFQRIPETPDGNFEELLLHALDYADEMKAEAERIDGLFRAALDQGRELRDSLKMKSNKTDRLTRAATIENELLDYKEI